MALIGQSILNAFLRNPDEAFALYSKFSLVTSFALRGVDSNHFSDFPLFGQLYILIHI